MTRLIKTLIMRKLLFLLYISVLNIFITNAQVNQVPTIKRCATAELLAKRKAADPSLEQRLIDEENKLQQWISQNANYKTESTITIPVVVHVVYKTAVQNISDAQIHSQIDVLNEDYGRKNQDTANTPTPWKSIAGNPDIKFCLASRKPNGDWTTGIVRKQTTVTEFFLDDAVKYSNQGGDDAWDVTKYFNIWVCNIPSVLGYAFYASISPPNDGFGPVIYYNAFGRVGTVSPPYDKGRTATHETGHCFDLVHIWGDDGGACSGTDYVNDTPNQESENYVCQTFPFTDACTSTGNGIMFMNYLDYAPDVCMNMFTKGQATRMVGAINSYYPSLKTSNGCQPPSSIQEGLLDQSVSFYPNPTDGKLNININSLYASDLQINIYNVVGEIIASNKVEHFNSGTLKMDLSAQPNGLYFVKVTDQSESIIKQIMISR